MKYFNLMLLLALSVGADCTDYYVLGSKHKNFSQNLQTKNTIAWDNSKNVWSVSVPMDKVDSSKYPCQNSGYLLVNDNTINYQMPPYKNDYYTLTKGWNYLASHEDGVNVVETFSSAKEVEFVYAYDDVTQVWAGYSGHEDLRKLMATTRLIFLKEIEPKVGFYVYASENVQVKIHTNQINSICQAKMHDKNYSVLIDSGLDDAMVYNKAKTIGLYSRYKAHHRRGVYGESRVALLYPNIKTTQGPLLRYGPAEPHIKIEFSKEYEEQKFYVYDFKEGKCYMGVFPSKKIPPIPTLEEASEPLKGIKN